MEEWSYPRKRHPAFAKTTKAKSSLGRKSRTPSTSTEQQEQPVAVPADSATIPSGVVAGEKLDYKALKKRDNRAAIVNAYSGYIKDTVSESDFFAAVRKFALAKASWKLKELPKLSQTEEDVVQEMVLAVIKNLPNFQGTPDLFYSWLHRIVHTRGLDAIEKAEQERDRHAFLILLDEDGQEFENPGLNGGDSYRHNGNVEYYDSPQYRRKLPEFIQGRGLQICGYIREDKTYPEIAEIMSISVDDVTNEVRKMRNEYKGMKAQGLLH